MQITKIDIKGFGKFNNAVFSPSSGLNIFYGANEAGKSTILAFIKAMFFGLKSGRRTREGAINQNKRFKPWSGMPFSGILEYKLDNGRYYTVGRNFENNTLTVYDEFSNNITGDFPADKETIAKFAEQHLGLSESVFERTAFLGQMQSSVNQEGRKILAERLINLKESGDEQVSYKIAVNALKETLITHVGSGRTTTRPINLLNSQLQEALENEKTSRDLHDISIETFRDLEKTQKEVEEHKERLSQLNKTRSELHQNEEIRMLYDNHKKLIALLEQIEQIDTNIGESVQRKNYLTKELEDLKGFRKFTRDDADRMIEDNIRYQLLEKEMGEMLQSKNVIDEKIIQTENELAQYNIFRREGHGIQEVLEVILKQDNVNSDEKTLDNRHLYTKREKALIVFIILSIVFLPAIYLTRTNIPDMIFKALAVCDISFFLISALVWVLLGRKKDRRKEQKDSVQELQNLKQVLKEWMIEADVANIHDLVRLKNMHDGMHDSLTELYEKKEAFEKEKIDLDIRMDGVKTDIIKRLKSAGLCDQDTFNEEDISNWKKGLERSMLVFNMLESLKKETESFMQKAESIYRHSGLVLGVDIKSRTQLEKAIEEISHRLGDQKPVSENVSLSLIDEQIEELRNKINKCNLKISALATRLENIPDDEMLQRAYEKLQALKEEKGGLIFLGKAIETAIHVMTEASVAIQRDYVPCLSRELNNYLSVLTGGLYDNVKADDNLSLNILPKEGLERILPEQLSSGTMDQVYMALRLAAVRLIEQDNESIPLFFDEPFSQYDEERTENALRFLIEESKHRQIFIFTCKIREVELADKMNDNKAVNIVHLSSPNPIFSQQS